MQVKEKWTNKDFNEMGWHDCVIHSISFPRETLQLELDIDYIFERISNNSIGLFNFYISPCTLRFFSVSSLKIEIDFTNTIGIEISEIRRINPTQAPNYDITLWTFIIETDKGIISFESSGFEQIVRKQPILNEAYNLHRNQD